MDKFCKNCALIIEQGEIAVKDLQFKLMRAENEAAKAKAELLKANKGLRRYRIRYNHLKNRYIDLRAILEIRVTTEEDQKEFEKSLSKINANLYGRHIPFPSSTFPGPKLKG
jgi:capsule polysaccharide export protein KpsE/RkpR